MQNQLSVYLQNSKMTGIFIDSEKGGLNFPFTRRRDGNLKKKIIIWDYERTTKEEN